MSRADLLALTADALVRLSNVGLVKRAQKEVESGVVPTLAEDADGTVVASARDGASTRLARGVSLQQTTCSCGSAQVCRHRIAAVLTYQRDHAAPAAEPANWDPGTITDEALVVCCGPQMIARADALFAKGLVATTRPGPPPSVAFPTATVQFLVPNEVAYAKCDCAKGNACEHVVLAVRAFRAAPEGGTVTLREETTAPATPAVDNTRATIDEALSYLIQYGLSAPGSAPVLERARAAAERARWWWVVDGLESVERLGEAYRNQSARFRLADLAREVGEIAARLRAANAKDAPLPAQWLLGSDQVGETAMEQVRLIALGARLDADGERRMVRVYFADPDTANVLVLDKTWPSEKRYGAELGALFASSRMSVTELARGELVTRAARRRANGSLDLGAARGMKSSLLPSTSQWGRLPEPLLVRDLSAHAARRQKLPPTCLCPRGLGAAIAVVEIGRVVDVERDGDGQSVTGLVEDPAGHRLIITTHHRQVAPGAVDTTATALESSPTFVAGELHGTADGFRMEPLSFVTKQLIVVDLQRPTARGAAKTDEDGDDEPASDPASRLAASTCDYVGRTLLKGARTTAALAGELAREAERLFAHRLATRFTRAATGTADAVLDLAILHQLER